MFSEAFHVIAPMLTIESLLIDHDRAASGLRERLTVDGAEREDCIAGFYRVDTNGVIMSAKIYRRGSADV